MARTGLHLCDDHAGGPGLRVGAREAGDVSEDLVRSKKHPAVYFPLRPDEHAQPSLRGITLLVRGTPGVDIIRAVEHEIAGLDARITPYRAASTMEHIAQLMSMLKAASWTYGFTGLFGLVLALVGLAGVTAYTVARRGREIGIRLARGAQKRDVLVLVMKEGVTLIAAGTVVGLALIACSGPARRSMKIEPAVTLRAE